MKNIEFSNNPKLQKLQRAILASLLKIHDTEEESINQVRWNVANYPEERDFNICSSGYMLCYFDEVRQLFRDCGYITKHYNNLQLWKMYEIETRQIAIQLSK